MQSLGLLCRPRGVARRRVRGPSGTGGRVCVQWVPTCRLQAEIGTGSFLPCCDNCAVCKPRWAHTVPLPCAGTLRSLLWKTIRRAGEGR